MGQKLKKEFPVLRFEDFYFDVRLTAMNDVGSADVTPRFEAVAFAVGC